MFICVHIGGYEQAEGIRLGQEPTQLAVFRMSLIEKIKWKLKQWFFEIRHGKTWTYPKESTKTLKENNMRKQNTSRLHRAMLYSGIPREEAALIIDKFNKVPLEQFDGALDTIRSEPHKIVDSFPWITAGEHDMWEDLCNDLKTDSGKVKLMLSVCDVVLG